MRGGGGEVWETMVEGSGTRKGLSGERQMFVASTKLLNVVSCAPHFEAGIVVKFFPLLWRTYRVSATPLLLRSWKTAMLVFND